MHAHKIVQLRFWGSSTPLELVARVIGKRFCGNGVMNENLCDPKKHQSFFPPKAAATARGPSGCRVEENDQ